MGSTEQWTEMRFFCVYFKQHSVYLTKEKVLLRAIRNHADKDTDRNTNFLFFFFLFFVCIKYFQNSRTNFTFLGIRRRKGLDNGPCCSILYVNNEYCGYDRQSHLIGLKAWAVSVSSSWVMPMPHGTSCPTEEPAGSLAYALCSHLGLNTTEKEAQRSIVQGCSRGHLWVSPTLEGVFPTPWSSWCL